MLFIPMILWKDDQVSIYVAGEKDMATPVYLVNSITFTGGEFQFPWLFASSFLGRIYIVLIMTVRIDGAYKVAMHIKDAGGIPYVVTGHQWKYV